MTSYFEEEILVAATLYWI